MRGPATVMARMMNTLITPPSSCHFGPPTASETPPSDRRVRRSALTAITPPMTAAVATASRLPTRSPSRPWTAICTAPPRPAAKARTAASPVELTARTLYAQALQERKEPDVIRVFVVYEEDPDPERFEQHAELCRRVEGSTFRHGKVFGAPMGEPRFKYYAEWEFAGMDAFRAAARTPEFGNTGVDAMEMGI